jgi:hypothetical protein
LATKFMGRIQLPVMQRSTVRMDYFVSMKSDLNTAPSSSVRGIPANRDLPIKPCTRT